MSKPKQTNVYGLYDRLKFGKHRGERVIDAMSDDPNWFHWAIEEVEGFELTNEAYAHLPPPREMDTEVNWGDYF